MKEKVLGRNKVFELLGTKLTNERWAWCAIAPDHSLAVFTLWKHEMINGRNQLLWTDYEVKHQRGAKDQERTLELVMRENIPAYGLICVAKDPDATPRSIKRVDAGSLIRLKIERDGEMIYGLHLERTHVLELVNAANRSTSDPSNGLVDLEYAPAGNETPDRALCSSYKVIRDSEVRKHVISQANGKCEYCGVEGFKMKNGQRYLEAHHIIALASQGRDTVDNVIALCADHHREAHYGNDAESLEREFIRIVSDHREWPTAQAAPFSLCVESLPQGLQRSGLASGDREFHSLSGERVPLFRRCHGDGGDRQSEGGCDPGRLV